MPIKWDLLLCGGIVVVVLSMLHAQTSDQVVAINLPFF